jgi:hypothetical protein
MTIQARRPVRSAARVAAISVTDPIAGVTELILNMDQDDLTIAIATVIASVVVALTLS